MEKDIEYEKNNIAFDWQYPKESGGGIKCKNYELCESVLPDWWFSCKGNYLCSECHMIFGTWGIKGSKTLTKTGKGVLDIYDNVECPICLDTKRSISYPNCEHTACIDCFKRCFYGDKDVENEPKFPYSEDIEDEYYENSENPKWNKDYPLIKIHNNEWDIWDDANSQKHENEDFLEKCPLCRK